MRGEVVGDSLARRWQGLSLMTGRGCPFHCAFCHEGHHTRRVRLRSVENVLQAVDLFLASWRSGDPPYILFTNDTFTLQPERVRALCEGLAERQRKRPFHWFSEGHVHTLYRHPEMIGYIAAGGAFSSASSRACRRRSRRTASIRCRTRYEKSCASAATPGSRRFTAISFGRARFTIAARAFWTAPDAMARTKDVLRRPEEHHLIVYSTM